MAACFAGCDQEPFASNLDGWILAKVDGFYLPRMLADVWAYVLNFEMT